MLYKIFLSILFTDFKFSDCIVSYLLINIMKLSNKVYKLKSNKKKKKIFFQKNVSTVIAVYWTLKSSKNPLIVSKTLNEISSLKIQGHEKKITSNYNSKIYIIKKNSKRKIHAALVCWV